MAGDLTDKTEPVETEVHSYMQITKTQRLVSAGLLTAVGLILPYFTAHIFGLPGTVLLPMHIPVFLIGLICGPYYGAICGLIIPTMSSLLTGMPTVFPMLPIMAGELTVYGFISGLLHQKTGRVYLSMIPAMICGRVIYGLIFTALTMAGGEELRALSVSAAFIQGLPGIAVQLVLIPVIVKTIARHRNFAGGQEPVTAVSALAEAKSLIQSGKSTCIVMRGGVITNETSGRGVKPILYFWENEPEILAGAAVADKIIGKAAAMLLILAGVRYVYGELMSVAGRDYLQNNGVSFEYGRCIEVISNREGNGICPLEKSVMDIDNPHDAYRALKTTISQLMKQVN